MKRSLGTQLRHLIELLDGAVGAAYLEAGLAYRPRYTPVMRALMERQPVTIGHIASAAGITQPAATQTIALMIKEGIVMAESGPQDGRQRLIRLTEQGAALVPRLVICWQATAAAAASLEAQCHLAQAIDCAIAALEQQSFGERIRQARAAQPPASATTS
ncbi:MAG: MarR family transcriptional regulator [Pseudomonadota bacterium]|nr:MarR family transcriptional regulator [Pseudomonadota bacterium]